MRGRARDAMMRLLSEITLAPSWAPVKGLLITPSVPRPPGRVRRPREQRDGSRGTLRLAAASRRVAAIAVLIGTIVVVVLIVVHPKGDGESQPA